MFLTRGPSRVEKRRGCRCSGTPLSFVQAHPRAVSDVTHSAFGRQGLKDVYEVICSIYLFGVPKRVERLVQLEF